MSDTDAFVFSRESFAWEDLDRDRIVVIPPAPGQRPSPRQDGTPGARERARDEFTSPRRLLDHLAVIKNLLARPVIRAAA